MKDDFDGDFDIDNFSMDEDLGFPGLFEEREHHEISPSKDFRNGLKDGFLSALASKDTLKAIIRNALPDNYTKAFEALLDTKDNLTELYDNAKEESEKAYNNSKEIIGKGLSHFQKEFGDKETFKKLKEWSKVDKLDYKRQEETEEEKIAKAIGDTFALFDKKEEERSEKAEASENLREAVQHERFKQNTERMDKAVYLLNRLNLYNEKVNVNVQRKSLELQYKQFFVQTETYKELKKTGEVIEKNLVALNTSVLLPDLIKLKRNEETAEYYKRNFKTSEKKSIIQKTSDAFGDLRKKIFDDLKSKIIGGFGKGNDLLKTVNDFIPENSDEDDGMSFGLSKYEMMGNMAGGMATEWGAGKLASRFKDKLAKNQKIVKGNNLLSLFFSNPEELLKRGIRVAKGKMIGGPGGEFAESIFDYLGGFLNENSKSLNTGISFLKGEALLHPAQFTHQTNKSIVEVIPGLLGKIHQEVASIRTANNYPLVPLVKFDYNTGRFSVKDNIQKNIFANLKQASDPARVANNFNDLMKEVDKDGVLDKKAREQLKDTLIRANISGKVLDKETVLSDDFITGDTERSKAIRQVLAKYFENDENFEKSANFNNVAKSIGESVSNTKDEIERLIELGYLEELIDEGIISSDGGTTTMDKMLRSIVSFNDEKALQVDRNKRAEEIQKLQEQEAKRNKLFDSLKNTVSKKKETVSKKLSENETIQGYRKRANDFKDTTVNNFKETKAYEKINTGLERIQNSKAGQSVKEFTETESFKTVKGLIKEGDIVGAASFVASQEELNKENIKKNIKDRIEKIEKDERVSRVIDYVKGNEEDSEETSDEVSTPSFLRKKEQQIKRKFGRFFKNQSDTAEKRTQAHDGIESNIDIDDVAPGEALVADTVEESNRTLGDRFEESVDRLGDILKERLPKVEKLRVGSADWIRQQREKAKDKGKTLKDKLTEKASKGKGILESIAGFFGIGAGILGGISKAVSALTGIAGLFSKLNANLGILGTGIMKIVNSSAWSKIGDGIATGGIKGGWGAVKTIAKGGIKAAGKGIIGLGKMALNSRLGGLVKGGLAGYGLGLAAEKITGALGGGETAQTVAGLAGNVIGYAAPGAVWAGAKLAGGLALKAGAALLANPVGLAVLGVGVLAYGAYKLFTRARLNTLSEFRWAQYGFTRDNKKHLGKIFALEDYLKDKVIVNGSDVKFDMQKVDLKEIFKILKIDGKNEEDAMRALNWLEGRFSKVYFTHLVASKEFTDKYDVHEADKLKEFKALDYLDKVKYPDGPYDMMEGPFKPGEQDIDVDRDGVKAAYEKTLNHFKNETRGKERETKSVSTTGALAGSTIADLNKTSNMGGDGVSQKSDVDNLTGVATTIDGVSNEKVKASLTITGDLGELDRGSYGTISALKAIRLRAYGLKELKVSRIKTLEKLQKAIYDQITFDGNKNAKWTGNIDEIYEKLSLDFGITDTKTKWLRKKWERWFEARFMPVFLNYIAYLSQKLSGENYIDREEELKPKEKIELMQKLLKAKNSDFFLDDAKRVKENPWNDGIENQLLHDNSEEIKASLKALEQQTNDEIAAEEKAKANPSQPTAEGAGTTETKTDSTNTSSSTPQTTNNTTLETPKFDFSKEVKNVDGSTSWIKDGKLYTNKGGVITEGSVTDDHLKLLGGEDAVKQYRGGGGVQNNTSDANSATVGVNNETANNISLDGIDKRAIAAADIAVKRASPTSLGYCAKYVRIALQKAGYKFQHVPSAYMYNSVMKSLGWIRVDPKAPPLKGDVVVWPGHRQGSKGGAIHGHIQIYSGTHWVSDFIQNSYLPNSKYQAVIHQVVHWRHVISGAGNDVKPSEGEAAETKPELTKDPLLDISSRMPMTDNTHQLLNQQQSMTSGQDSQSQVTPTASPGAAMDSTTVSQPTTAPATSSTPSLSTTQGEEASVMSPQQDNSLLKGRSDSQAVFQGKGGKMGQMPVPKSDGFVNMRDTIVAAGNMVGINPMILSTIAAQESGFKAAAKASTSSATGLFQFISSTWNAMLRKYGPKYGIPPGTSPTNPMANAILGACYIKENFEAVRNALSGREPTATDAYILHFLGTGGGKKFLSANPNTPASSVVSNGQVSANKAIFYSNGAMRTVGQVYDFMKSKLEKQRKAFRIDEIMSSAGFSTSAETGGQLGSDGATGSSDTSAGVSSGVSGGWDTPNTGTTGSSSVDMSSGQIENVDMSRYNMGTGEGSASPTLDPSQVTSAADGLAVDPNTSMGSSGSYDSSFVSMNPHTAAQNLPQQQENRNASVEVMERGISIATETLAVQKEQLGTLKEILVSINKMSTEKSSPSVPTMPQTEQKTADGKPFTNINSPAFRQNAVMNLNRQF